MDGLVDDHYIIVPKWERFQHYKDRDPLWIKVYTKLLHDPSYMGLSLASRGLLQVIWLAYASESLTLRIADARRLVGTSFGIGVQLISLRDAGFIDISASKLLATKTEREIEKERETPLPPLEDFPLDELPPFVSRVDELRALAGKAPRNGLVEDENDW